ncbi:MAG: hypothetical protein O6940_06055 [Ignavibacteria bacterium]|nr:hypothetical protein [Ignavibacteria bacterium]
MQNIKHKKLIRKFAAPVPKREIGFVYNKTIAKTHLISALKKEIMLVISKELKGKEVSLIVH